MRCPELISGCILTRPGYGSDINTAARFALARFVVASIRGCPAGRLPPSASAAHVDDAPIPLTDPYLVAVPIADCAIGKVPPAAIIPNDVAKSPGTKQPRTLRAGYRSPVVQAAAGADDDLSARFLGKRDR